MAKRSGRNKTIIIIIVALAGVTAWRWLRSSAPEATPADGRVSAADAARLLENRNWLDLWPTDEAQKLHVFRFTPAMGGGVYQDRTLFKGQFELFTYEVDDDNIHFDFPHEKQKVTTRFWIERVSGPEPFDLRLTLDVSPRGPRTYYGRSVEGSTGLAPAHLTDI